MVEDKFLKESQIYQKLLDTAKKYGVADYIPGQSFDAYKDKMSAEDYEKSQKLLEYYGLQNSLTDRYDYSNKIIEQERFKALQENSIAKAMTMKYLPEYLKLQGMGGLGVSESSIISANNNYRNNRNKINTDANYQKEDLLNKYKENISTLDGKSLSDLYEIREYYQKIADNEREQQKNLVDNFYRNEMLTNPEYYTEHGTKLTEDGKNKLKKYLDDNKEVLGGLYDTLIKELNAREVYTNAEKRTEKRAKLKYENQKNGFYSGGGMMSGGSYGR